MSHSQRLVREAQRPTLSKMFDFCLFIYTRNAEVDVLTWFTRSDEDIACVFVQKQIQNIQMY
jgi:hypothetical protein